MTRLRYLGETTYRGYDAWAGRMVVVEPGGLVVVSDEKARELEANFPGQWDRLGRVRPRRRHRPHRDKMTHPQEDK